MSPFTDKDKIISEQKKIIGEILNSRSFRIGKFVTAPYRLFKKIIGKL